MYFWLVVETTPLKNMSQLRWWHSQLNGEIRFMFQSPPTRLHLFCSVPMISNIYVPATGSHKEQTRASTGARRMSYDTPKRDVDLQRRKIGSDWLVGWWDTAAPGEVWSGWDVLGCWGLIFRKVWKICLRSTDRLTPLKTISRADRAAICGTTAGWLKASRSQTCTELATDRTRLLQEQRHQRPVKPQ